jgi:hypothetical protein
LLHVMPCVPTLPPNFDVTLSSKPIEIELQSVAAKLCIEDEASLHTPFFVGGTMLPTRYRKCSRHPEWRQSSAWMPRRSMICVPYSVDERRVEVRSQTIIGRRASARETNRGRSGLGLRGLGCRAGAELTHRLSKLVRRGVVTESAHFASTEGLLTGPCPFKLSTTLAAGRI